MTRRRNLDSMTTMNIYRFPECDVPRAKRSPFDFYELTEHELLNAFRSGLPFDTGRMYARNGGHSRLLFDGVNLLCIVALEDRGASDEEMICGPKNSACAWLDEAYVALATVYDRLMGCREDAEEDQL